MANRGARTLDMTSGTIWRKLLRFSFPLMVENLFQLLYNTADTMIVGRCIGDEAIAAIGATTQIVHFLTYIFLGLATGGTVVIAQHYGAKNHPAVKRDISNLFLLALISGVHVFLFGFLIVYPLLRVTKTPPEIIDAAARYLRIYTAGIPATAFFSIGSGILRAIGDSRSPVLILIGSSLLNIVLDYTFIAGFSAGISGVAWATVFAQYAAAAVILYLFYKGDSLYRFTLRELSFDSQTMKNVLRISAPQAIERSITSISNVYVQSYINYFGAVCIASYTIYSRLDAFVFLLITSIGTATLTFTGQNTGARQYARLRQGLHTGLALSVLFTVIAGSLMLLFRYPLARLFTDSEQIVAFSAKISLCVVPFFLLICVYTSYGSFLKGVGAVLPATVAMLGGFVVFKQIFLFFVTHYLINTPMLVLMTFPMGWGVCTVITLGYYISGKWKMFLR